MIMSFWTYRPFHSICFFNRGVYPIANGKLQVLSSFLVPTRVSCKNQVILSVQLHICWGFYVVIVAPSVTMPSTAVMPTSSLSSDFYSWVMIWNANTCYLIFFKTIQHTMRLLNSDHWTEGKWHLSQQWCHYYHHNQKKSATKCALYIAISYCDHVWYLPAPTSLTWIWKAFSFIDVLREGRNSVDAGAVRSYHRVSL